MSHFRSIFISFHFAAFLKIQAWVWEGPTYNVHVLTKKVTTWHARVYKVTRLDFWTRLLYIVTICIFFFNSINSVNQDPDCLYLKCSTIAQINTYQSPHSSKTGCWHCRYCTLYQDPPSTRLSFHWLILLVVSSYTSLCFCPQRYLLYKR